MRTLTLSFLVVLALVIGLVASPALAPSTTADEDGAADTDVDPELFALGGISAADLWTTYMVIGAVSDHFVKDGYKAAQVHQIMKARRSFNSKAIQSLQKVAAQPNLAPGEKLHVAGVNGAYTSLNEYADALVTFTNDKSVANANAFEAKRKAAWAKISKVLGIK